MQKMISFVWIAIYAVVVLVEERRCSPNIKTVVWSDEFSYKGLPNASLWILWAGTGASQGTELQYYTNSSKNFNVINESLIITSNIEQSNGLNYTSGRLKAARTFRYGYFEMRAILPQGRGVFPAFWLVKLDGKWPAGGEIDIFENIGCQPTQLQAGVHSSDYYWGTNRKMNNATTIVNNNATYHTYAVDWNAKRILAYVDDKLFFQYWKPINATNGTWPFDNDYSLIINNAIGGSWAGMYGIDNSIFPTSYVIDYVRVFPSQG